MQAVDLNSKCELEKKQNLKSVIFRIPSLGFHLRHSIFGSLIALFIIALLIVTRSVSANPYWFQVGAHADIGSVNVTGASVEIRTHVPTPSSPQSQSGTGTTFWVGLNLPNDAFIQVGYYCPEATGYPQWFWEYFPPGTASSGGGFAKGSIPDEESQVGPDGSWHTYSLQSSGNTWYTYVDGVKVGSYDLGVSNSGGNTPYAVAEVYGGVVVTNIILGPAEFRNLAYRDINSVWHNVSAAIGYIGLGAGSGTLPSGENIPYGLQVLGPSDWLAGSGLPPAKNGQLLWAGFIPTHITSSTDFSLSVSPNIVQLNQHGSAPPSFSLNVTVIGSGGTIKLSESGLPSDFKLVNMPTSAGGSSLSTETYSILVEAGNQTPNGNYTVTITGISGNFTHSTGLTIRVTSLTTTSIETSIHPTFTTQATLATQSGVLTNSPSSTELSNLSTLPLTTSLKPFLAVIVVVGIAVIGVVASLYFRGRVGRRGQPQTELSHFTPTPSTEKGGGGNLEGQFCDRCGSSLVVGSKFCDKCGAEQ